MLWRIQKEARRLVRRIGRRIGAISIYDFYDWKTPWASKKEIEQDKKLYNELNKDERFTLHSKDEIIIRQLKHIKSEHGISYAPTYVRDLWGAKQIYKHKPTHHYDCGSSFAGFITLLIPMGFNITLIDVRDLTDKFNTTLFKNSWGGGRLSQVRHI